MATWLEIDTYRQDGRPTDSGKALVSRFESGKRVPDPTTFEKYVEAHGADDGELRHVYARATRAVSPAGVRTTSDTPPSTGSETLGRRARVARYLVGAVVALAAVIVVIVAIVIVVRDDDSGSPTGDPTESPAVLSNVKLVFDALGTTADQTIYVYPGYTNAAEDKKPDLSYHSGESARVICQVQGRRVDSDPSAGERERTSDIWVRIQTDTGLVRYATLTYARFDPENAKVPYCR